MRIRLFLDIPKIGKHIKSNRQTDYFNFIANYSNHGEQKNIYELRAAVLFHVKRCNGDFLNCWDTIADVVSDAFQHVPGICCVREIECRLGCNPVTQQQYILDPPGSGNMNIFDILEAEIVQLTSPQIEDCGTCSFRSCCRVNVHLGPLLIIDVSLHFRTDRNTGQPIRMSSLREITPSLELQSKKYRLVGVIAYVHGNHFVPYTKSPDGSWECRDDMCMNNVIRVLSENESEEKNLVLNAVM